MTTSSGLLVGGPLCQIPSDGGRRAEDRRGLFPYTLLDDRPNVRPLQDPPGTVPATMGLDGCSID